MRHYAPMGRGVYELARAFAMAPAVEKAAERRAMNDALTGALTQARIENYRTEADLNRRRLAGMEEGRNRFLAGATGLTRQQLDELDRAMQEGWMRQAEGPPTPTGEYPMMDTRPDWATPDVENRFRQANLALGANLVGTGKTNGEQLVAALQRAQNLGLQRKMLAGEADPNDIARIMGAMAGKPTVDVTGSGIAFNPYGDKNDLNVEPFMAKAKVEGGGRNLPDILDAVEYYKGLGYPQTEAENKAKRMLERSLSELMTKAYMDASKAVVMIPPPKGVKYGTPEYMAWRDRMVEQIARQAIRFAQQDAAGSGAGSDSADPLGLRR